VELMQIPEDCKYSKEHEWVKMDGDLAIMGITDYAQDQLGEIVFVELPQEGEHFAQGDALGIVESVKSVSDIFAPVSCEVIEVNDPLTDTPETLNDEPFGEGWMVKIKLNDESEFEALMDATEYEAFIKEESE
jgi:glycine cleavage system H protein